MNKLISLEIIRFICSLMVLIFHYNHFNFIEYQENISIKNQLPFYQYLEFIYNHGNYAVDVFWILSGFIFFNNYRKKIIQKQVSGQQFFILRFARLYPLHIATLLIVAILQFIHFQQINYFFIYKFNDSWHFILNIFFMENWFNENQSFNSPSWSVSVEILVYFFFFISFRLFKTKYIIVYLLFIFALASYFDNKFIFYCFFFFYMGGLIQLIYSTIELKKINNIDFFKISLLISIIILIFILEQCLENILNLKILLIILLFLIFIFINFDKFERLKKFILNLGNITYSCYMIHFPLQLIIKLYYLSIDQPIPYLNKYFFLFFIFTTLLVSYIIFNYFEMPIKKIILKKFYK